MIFLIEYDRDSGLIVTLRPFEEAERRKAEDSRLELEVALNRRRISREVVLLEAETEEALRETHQRYFNDLAGLVKRELRLIAFLPWLRLDQTVSMGDVQFIPFRVSDVHKDEALHGLTMQFVKILSSYVDIRNKPVDRCTVVAMNRRQPAWNLTDEDFEEVREAASLLYLAAMAANEYFQQIRPYANRTMFDLYWQRFTEPVDYISMTARRREGELLMGGHKHGEVKFTIPVHADSRDPVSLDVGLVEALNKVLTGSPDLSRRLRPAVAFLSLANTDSDVMPPSAEVILMGSAFEQFLEAHGARDLSEKFSDRFLSFGSVTVDEALKARSGIVVDRKYAAAQKNWFVHRKWMEEFYQLRNDYVHGKTLSARTWGWAPLEHLVMAAFAFPLTVKLILSRHGYYTLNRRDREHCGALDLLLGSTDWREFAGSGMTVWQEKLLESGRKLAVSEATRALEEIHSDRHSEPDTPGTI